MKNDYIPQKRRKDGRKEDKKIKRKAKKWNQTLLFPKCEVKLFSISQRNI